MLRRTALPRRSALCRTWTLPADKKTALPKESRFVRMMIAWNYLTMRRRRPNNPITPMPSNAIVDGSGMTETQSLPTEAMLYS